MNHYVDRPTVCQMVHLENNVNPFNEEEQLVYLPVRRESGGTVFSRPVILLAPELRPELEGNDRIVNLGYYWSPVQRFMFTRIADHLTVDEAFNENNMIVYNLNWLRSDFFYVFRKSSNEPANATMDVSGINLPIYRKMMGLDQ